MSTIFHPYRRIFARQRPCWRAPPEFRSGVREDLFAEAGSSIVLPPAAPRIAVRWRNQI